MVCSVLRKWVCPRPEMDSPWSETSSMHRLILLVTIGLGSALAAAAEFNPARTHAVSIGTDTATITVQSTSASTDAPASAETIACAQTVSVAPLAQTIAQAFSPASVGLLFAAGAVWTRHRLAPWGVRRTQVTDRIGNNKPIRCSRC